MSEEGVFDGFLRPLGRHIATLLLRGIKYARIFRAAAGGIRKREFHILESDYLPYK
jgi:hypothetical protein